MLYIKYEKQNIHANIQWHVGSPIPLKFEEYQNIIEIQADGHELTAIIDSFSWTEKGHYYTSIPYNPKQRVHRWFGDIARTIIANMNTQS